MNKFDMGKRFSAVEPPQWLFPYRCAHCQGYRFKTTWEKKDMHTTCFLIVNKVVIYCD